MLEGVLARGGHGGDGGAAADGEAVKDPVVLLEVELEAGLGFEDGAGATDRGVPEGGVALGEDEAARALDGLDLRRNLDAGRVCGKEGVGVAARGEDKSVTPPPTVALNAEARDAEFRRPEGIAKFVYDWK